MNKLLLTIPAIYGDHHATAVRQILESLSGVGDIFISPATYQLELGFDPDQTDETSIKDALLAQGYSEGTETEIYPTSPTERTTRHTETFGDSLIFRDTPPAWQGRPLWPCPGLDYQINLDELGKEGVDSDGKE